MEQIEYRCIGEKIVVQEPLQGKNPVFSHTLTPSVSCIHHCSARGYSPLVFAKRMMEYPYEVRYTGSPRTAVPQLLQPDVSDTCCKGPAKILVQGIRVPITCRRCFAPLKRQQYSTTCSLFPSSSIHSGRFCSRSRPYHRECAETVRTGDRPSASMLPG